VRLKQDSPSLSAFNRLKGGRKVPLTTASLYYNSCFNSRYKRSFPVKMLKSGKKRQKRQVDFYDADGFPILCIWQSKLE
jgi:hypothetical protein